MRRGLPVSPGVAVGTAYCIDEIFVSPGTQRLRNQEIPAELAKYEAARDHAARDLISLEKKLAEQVGPDETAIFEAHRSILRDAAFNTTIPNWIVDERLTAQAALQKLLEQYTDVFARVEDEYLKDRLNDIRDVVLRINSHLSDPKDMNEDGVTGPLIVVADQLLPSQVVMLGDMEVNGIVTQAGSQTSHAAILARSRGIPAVSGVQDILRQINTGDTVVVDGKEGRVIIAPDAETRAAYLKLEREFFDFKDHLAENRDQPAITSDGVSLNLLANINSVTDAEAATAMGATGVGLFRTEYLYLTHPVVPGEEEQLREYVSIIEASPNHSVTIRTLDIGGDKTVPFMGHVHREANPFMGWRSIRLSFEHPGVFNSQLRAVMRAAAVAQEMGGDVRLMFPMITTLEEIRRVRGLVRKARKQLIEEGKTYADVRIGMMLEVPAAAISIGSMLSLVDFVSIGSNDLVQYLMAADRDNPKVSHLCQPLAPPVLRVLTDVIRTCTAAGKPLTLCGEMAGQPTAFTLLLGMGLRSFSMSPAFIPFIKEFARHITTKAAEQLLEHALTLTATGRIRRYMTDQLAHVVPDFDRFEIS
ncbi:MAG: phosphoenolpyruvate--protein phosphotransferase [Planctomycetes bacterium]|nr:phosphoenolpyruvate--protein phosphotransferase [Planctomycetota bacterium]